MGNRIKMSNLIKEFTTTGGGTKATRRIQTKRKYTEKHPSDDVFVSYYPIGYPFGKIFFVRLCSVYVVKCFNYFFFNLLTHGVCNPYCSLSH